MINNIDCIDWPDANGVALRGSAASAAQVRATQTHVRATHAHFHAAQDRIRAAPTQVRTEQAQAPARTYDGIKIRSSLKVLTVFIVLVFYSTHPHTRFLA